MVAKKCVLYTQKNVFFVYIQKNAFFLYASKCAAP